MLREEYQGAREPDKITDPIGHAIWMEANQCPDCWGTGGYIPKSDQEHEIICAGLECQTCQGRGVIPEMFDPNY